jgi:hypothetical protein
MSFQVLNLVLYSFDGRSRTIEFNAGRMNVIAGDTHTGKSALIDIVDYCLGAGECRVPEGPIRRKVAWFGLRLQVAGGQAMIARRCPEGYAQSSEDCFVEMAEVVQIPLAPQVRKTTNVQGLVSVLNRWCGIPDNIYEPPAGQTRASTTATIRQASVFCFQTQNEISRKEHLFHGSADTYVERQIRDTLPFFLGAVDDQHIRKREELRRLQDRLRNIDRQLAELTGIQGEGTSKASVLLAQARDAGLTETSVNDWKEIVDALRQVSSVPLATVETREESPPEVTEYDRLGEERTRLMSEHRQVSDEVSLVRALEREEKGFSVEASEQRARLSSIGIFEGTVPGTACPLCTQVLPQADGSTVDAALRSELRKVATDLEAVGRASPNIEKAVAELNTKLHSIQHRLSANRAAMNAVRSQNVSVQSARDDIAGRAMILGRISLYLESLPELPDSRELDEEKKALVSKRDTLEEELSDETVRERLNSILAILGRRMTEWARHLKLEHSELGMRLDDRKLTVVADTNDGPVPMARMGSGENWVGCHLTSHMAIHALFVERNRPVPRFLFLDQPSQVYFPNENDVDGTFPNASESDWQAVVRMFKFIHDEVSRLGGGLQIVVTEHAEINEPWYKGATIERWRHGTKLVPEDWPRGDETGAPTPQ